MKPYLMIYDISNNAKRSKAAKILDNFGERVQESAFEVLVDENGLKRILNFILELLGKEDSFRVYPLCAACKKEILWFGEGKEPFEIRDFYIV